MQKLSRKDKTGHIYSEISFTKKCLTHHLVIKIRVEELECASGMFDYGISAVGRERSKSSTIPGGMLGSLPMPYLQLGSPGLGLSLRVALPYP